MVGHHQEGRKIPQILMPALGQRKEPEIPVEKIKQQMNERHTTFDQVTELIARIKLGTGG